METPLQRLAPTLEGWTVRWIGVRAPGLQSPHLEWDSREGRPLYRLPDWEPLRPERMPEPEVWEMLQSLLQTLTHLHGQGFLHANIRPETVGRSATQWILNNSGHTRWWSAAVQASPYDEVCRHFEDWDEQFAPPEVAKRWRYSFASDVWALGALVFGALLGEPFVDAEQYDPNQFVRDFAIRCDTADGVRTILRRKLEAYGVECSTPLLTILSRMLHPNDTRRLSSALLLEHVQRCRNADDVSATEDALPSAADNSSAIPWPETAREWSNFAWVLEQFARLCQNRNDTEELRVVETAYLAAHWTVRALRRVPPAQWADRLDKPRWLAAAACNLAMLFSSDRRLYAIDSLPEIAQWEMECLRWMEWTLDVPDGLHLRMMDAYWRYRCSLVPVFKLDYAEMISVVAALIRVGALREQIRDGPFCHWLVATLTHVPWNSEIWPDESLRRALSQLNTDAVLC